MKKFFVAALLAVSLVTTAYAGDSNENTSDVNLLIRQKFSEEFGNLKDVDWSVKDEFAKATFILNNEKTQAFFSLNGELIGVSKSVTIDQMPVNVKRVFAKKYSDYIVKETIRFDNPDESSYFISAENDSKSIVLKVTVAGAVSMFQSFKKN